MSCLKFAAAIRQRSVMVRALACAALVSTVSVDALAAAAPSISGSPATSIVAAHYYAFQPSVSDPSGAQLSFSITNKPSWATFDTTTGRLYGTPLPQTNVALYSNIEIAATVGTAHVSLASFSITVKPLANSPPVVSGSPATTVASGHAYTFQPTATDPNGLKIVFSASNLPSWATFNSSTGQVSGTPAAANAGTYSDIVITAYDGYFKGTLPAFDIVVEGASNTAPPASAATASATLVWTPPTENNNGSVLTDLAGYHIYYGATPELGQTLTLTNVGLARYVMSGLTQTTYYFTMTAFDKAGHESDRTAVESIEAE
jgi:hypothetical protein